MQDALAVVPAAVPAQITINPEEYFKPVAGVAVVMERQRQLAEIISQYLIEARVDSYGNVNMDGADYGLLPGTKTRTLFQPGAEKLALVFGLTVTAYCTEKQEDWDTGFFRYTFKATASFKGQTIRETTRTCHTREKKYAWIWVNRPKPADQDTINEMIEQQTGRWGTKWEKQNGRNVKTTVWQERRPNPDPFSLQFVVEAMAQKRAKVAVVKEALAATGYFGAEFDFDEFAGEAQQEPAAKPAAEPARDAADDTGPTRFWAAARKAGIATSDASPIANRAISGEITWADAIGQLPN